MANTPLPAFVPAAIRVLFQVATAGFISSGKLSPESAEGLLAIVLSIAAFAWGMYKTNDREKKLDDAGVR